MRIAISLGGSLVFHGGPNVKVLARLRKLFGSLDGQFAIAVGGGTIARVFVEAARKFTKNNFDLDETAISVTKANARLVSIALKARYADSLDQAVEFLEEGAKIVVIGGTEPAQTTDTVAAMLAEEINADRFVNLSDVRGIFDKNPKARGAKVITEMSHKKLVDLTEHKDKRRPRENFIFDLLAANILARSKIEAHFVDGSSAIEARKAILGKPHHGTVIKT